MYTACYFFRFWCRISEVIGYGRLYPISNGVVKGTLQHKEPLLSLSHAKTSLAPRSDDSNGIALSLAHPTNHRVGGLPHPPDHRVPVSPWRSLALGRQTQKTLKTPKTLRRRANSRNKLPSLLRDDTEASTDRKVPGIGSAQNHRGLIG